MAKTIKFNLIMDGYPVRTIPGLQEHFSIEDILDYYDSGLLKRWLSVRGYDDYFSRVDAIDPSCTNEEIIMQLVQIFGIETDKQVIEESISILQFLHERNELNSVYNEMQYKKEQIIDDYHSGYKELIDNIVSHNDNMALLKADAIKMEAEYSGLFELDYQSLYFFMVKNAPKAIFAMLTRPMFREKWLSEEDNYKIIYESIKKYFLRDKQRIKDVLGDDLKIVHRNTQAMWDPIERPEVKIVAISIEYGTFIKNAGEFSEKLGSSDVNDKLLLMNGLEYQCNNESAELLYMEV